MEFEVEAVIDRSQEEVFAFFRDMHQLPSRKGSLVPVYDKITPGPVGVGTRIREVVRLLPFVGDESSRRSPATIRPTGSTTGSPPSARWTAG